MFKIERIKKLTVQVSV